MERNREETTKETTTTERKDQQEQDAEVGIGDDETQSDQQRNQPPNDQR